MSETSNLLKKRKKEEKWFYAKVWILLGEGNTQQAYSCLYSMMHTSKREYCF